MYAFFKIYKVLPIDTLTFLNDFIDINISLVLFQQYSVGYLYEVSWEKDRI